MFSVTPEPAVSNPAYGSQAKQSRADQPPSDGFAALVDSNAATGSESRSAPDAPLPPRRGQRDQRQADAPQANNDTSRNDASSASNDAPPAAQQDKAAAAVDAKISGDKPPGKVKASGDKKTENTQDADADATAAVPAVPAIVADAVAAVVTVATETVATPDTTDAATSPSTSVAATAAAAAAVITASATATTDPSLAETSNATSETGTAAALPADSATPEASAAKIAATAGVIHSASGKTEVSAKNVETAASVKDGKDAKQAEGQSPTASDQAIKPETDTKDAEGKPGQHDKAAADVTESPDRTTKSASHAEHRTPAPAQLALQSDPGLQSPAAMPQQPVQTHSANLTAIPVASTQTALATSTPVPLDSLAADIALRAAGGNSRFEIRLDPAELGRIDVRLDVDKHGNVTSHLTVERPATLDMLRNDAPRLQQALEDAGLKTGDSGLQFSLRDQSSSGQNSDNGSGRNSQRVIITDEDTVPAQVAGRTYGRMLGSSGGVDIRI